jgi:hypothetical protein
MAAMRAMRSTVYADDHFEPEALDPQAQRRIRGHLEQIDYMAFAANREVFAQMLGHVTVDRLQRLAAATAKARARWVARALEITAGGLPSTEQAHELGALRGAFDELAEAYEGLRRMVERGYVSYAPAEAPAA